MMSRDSLDQWREVTTFKFDDWHPAFDSFAYWLLTRLWFSPAIICLFQMLVLASVFAYGMGQLEKRGLPKWALVSLTLFFSLFPLNGFYVNTLFKDVPFAIAVLLLALFTEEIVASRGAWLATARHAVGLAVVLALVWLIRHNGLLTSVVTLGSLAVVYARYRKQLALIALGCGALVLLVKGPLYSAIHVNGRPYALDILMAHQMSAVLHDGTQPTAPEKAVLEHVLPLPLWKAYYNPFQSDSLVFSKSFNYTYLGSEAGRRAYMATWASLVPRNLPALLAHQSHVSELAWRPDHQAGSYTYSIHPLLDANDQGLATKSVLPPIQTFLLRAYYFSHSVGLLRALIYRPALYTYLSLLCVGLSGWLLRDRTYLLVLVPLLSIVGGIVLTAPAQHVRYLYPCFLLAPFFAGYLVLHLTRRQARG
ncbi:DUF6020 family protein [Hymenobacter bucti]|uniref:DUF6020 family protein n=1 Tax=Hymenobacter bucti TaxID=1844114 RepID=A0ABW4QR08_9BACT